MNDTTPPTPSVESSATRRIAVAYTMVTVGLYRTSARKKPTALENHRRPHSVPVVAAITTTTPSIIRRPALRNHIIPSWTMLAITPTMPTMITRIAPPGMIPANSRAGRIRTAKDAALSSVTSFINQIENESEMRTSPPPMSAPAPDTAATVNTDCTTRRRGSPRRCVMTWMPAYIIVPSRINGTSHATCCWMYATEDVGATKLGEGTFTQNVPRLIRTVPRAFITLFAKFPTTMSSTNWPRPVTAFVSHVAVLHPKPVHASGGIGEPPLHHHRARAPGQL